MSGNATLASGQARSIGMAWDGGAPYRVSFRCGVPGCANVAVASTTSTTLSRRVQRTTCTGETALHSLSVTNRGGTRATAQSRTTWARGAAC